MKHQPILLLAAAALVSCQSASTTTTPTSSQPDRFTMADINHDGMLSFEEASHSLDHTAFDARDDNHDGKATRAEWSPGNVASETKDFNAHDANHDGVVTLAEYEAHAQKAPDRRAGFNQADANHDGQLSRTETLAYYASKE